MNDLRNLISLLSALEDKPKFETQPYAIGENYLIRTVTYTCIGKVVEVGEKEILLKDASWVADTGPFHEALRDGTLAEVEPYIDHESVIVGRGAVVDATRWSHPLPRVRI